MTQKNFYTKQNPIKDLLKINGDFSGIINGRNFQFVLIGEVDGSRGFHVYNNFDELKQLKSFS